MCRYYTTTGTLSHVSFCTIECGEGGTIRGVGADNHDTFSCKGSWKLDSFTGSINLALNFHYHSNETIRYREKGNVCHVGWWCDAAHIITGSSLVPGACHLLSYFDNDGKIFSNGCCCCCCCCSQ